MAQPTQYATSLAARALGLVLLVIAVLSACSSDDGVIESESVPTTPTTASDSDENLSTTTPGDDESTSDSTTDPGGMPSSLWGVEAGSYDLVRLEIASGDIVERITGWGAEAASGEQEGGVQALQQVAAKGDSLWVADCCEPAVGTVFRVDPAVTASVPEAEVNVNGTTPVLSPDGTRLAVSVLDIGVAVHDAATGEMLVSPELIGALVTPPGRSDTPMFAAPVTWIDDDTVAVRVNDGDTSTVTMVSVTEPSAPTVVGPTIEVDGSIIDGATRADGSLVVAVESTGGRVLGHVYSATTGQQDATFPLDQATTAIDYDASGTYLLVARENLTPAWQGLGETGELGETSLVFAAWAGS